MSPSLGIGFIGAGGITRLRHAPGLAGIAGVELVAVANRTQGLGREFRRRLRGPDRVFGLA